LKIVKNIIPENYSDLEFLREEFGQYKIYPRSLELPILVALSYFPELKYISIEFKEKKATFAFASRPDLGMFGITKATRKYQIVLSTESQGLSKDLLFRALPLNAQVGILGHELSHTAFYLSKSLVSLVKIGILYFYNPFRISFEKNTDKATIERGLGFQLLDFSMFSQNHPKATEKYKNWLNKYYLNPEQISQYIKSLPQYGDL
jgi:hypothetical protein